MYFEKKYVFVTSKLVAFTSSCSGCTYFDFQILCIVVFVVKHAFLDCQEGFQVIFAFSKDTGKEVGLVEDVVIKVPLTRL